MKVKISGLVESEMTAIAIDGPAGAGKSTIARCAAKAIGFIYVDTGALYRAIGLYMLNRGVDPAKAEEVRPLLQEVRISLAFEDGEQHVLLCGRDVSQEIRTPQVSMAASGVSAIPEVRSFLFSLQQDIAKRNNVVMDGRDIGTVVLPNAQLKIFLTASPEERAKRRYEEMLEKGQKVDYNNVLSDLVTRDYNDSHRAVAPLIPAENAVIVDTTGNTLEQSVAQLISIIQNRINID
jgi:cytidylate kinase